MITSEYQTLPAIVGASSCVAYLGEQPYPRLGGNYFWLSNGVRILNFRAENFQEAIKRYLDDGMVEVRVWKWTNERGGEAQVAVICDGRIPDEWFDKRMCFTGFERPPVGVVQQIYEAMGDPHYEFERFIDPDLYYARQGFIWKAYEDGIGGCAKPSPLTPEELMQELKDKRGGLLSVVHTHEEDGVTYQVEKLHPPVLRGAGERHYRLWQNGKPATGRQYHYTFQTAISEIDYLVQRGHHDQVKSLDARIARLERSNRLMNGHLTTGSFDNLRHTDIWNEVRELTHMVKTGAVDEEIEGQEKRIRTMLRELEAK